MAPDGTVVGVWQTASNEVQASVRAPGRAPGSVRTLNANAAEPRVAVGGNGTAIAIWNALGTIQYAVRPPGGSFSAPANLGSGGDPVVAMNQAGAAVMAWSSGTDVEVRVREPNGAFVSPNTIAAAGADQLDAVINQTSAASSTGVILLAWRSGGLARAAIRFSDRIWKPPVVLDAAASSNPQVAIDRTGIGTAVWQRGTAIRWAPRGPGSAVFGGSQQLSGAGAAATPDVAASPGARTVALWRESGIIRSAFRSGASGFGAPDPISDPNSSSPRVAINSGGAAFAVWQGTTGTFDVIQGAVTGSSGGFGAVENISNPLADSDRPAVGADGGGNAATVYEQETADRAQVAGYDGAPPALAGLSVPTSGVPGAVLPMSLSPFDVWSPVTTTWNFGDGQAATGNAVSHAYGSAGTFNLAVTARDAAGNAASTSRPVQIFSPPPPDGDGDGFNVTLDCNDGNRTIFPGARETPGDKIDQDCNGADAPFPLLLADVTFSFDRNAARTRFFLTQLAIKDALRGMRIEMRCSGKPKCTFKRKRAGKARRARVNILKKLNRKQRRFKLGQTLTVRMTMPGHMGKVTRIKFGKRKTRSVELCLPPGAKKPRKRCT